MRTILGLSGDAFWGSFFRGFQLGYIDVPFSPHSDNMNRMISIRDANGSIRIADPGNVPIGASDAKLERKRLESRTDRSEKTYRQMLADITIMA